MADINSLEAERQRLLSQRAALAQQALAGDNAATQQIRQINTQLAAVVADIESLLQPNSTTAAGELAGNDGSATQAPALPATDVNERLNTQQAAALAGETETGTNPPVKKLTETQSVSPDDSNADPGVITSPYYAPGTGANTADPSLPTAGGAPGVGAQGEDGQTATNTTRILNSFNKQPFAPQPNVLDQYASYTYNIGWYLLKPNAYTEMQKSHKPVLSNYSLLIQSGGAPSDFGDIKNNIVGRSPFFKNDYYIDNLKIESTVTGKGSNLAHNANSLEFTVTEPANITLIDNLWKAVKDQYQNTEVPYSTAFYALVIRFYGYDEEGKIAQAANNNVVVEKIIPFKIADISFSVANKLVEYTVKGTAIPYLVGFGANLGVVKSNIEISGATVKDLLTSGVVLAEVSPSDGRKTSTVPDGRHSRLNASTDPRSTTYNPELAADQLLNSADPYIGGA